jgi:hypothetical protein
MNNSGALASAESKGTFDRLRGQNGLFRALISI